MAENNTSRTLVSFGEKHRKGRKSDGEGRQTSATAAIPVVVLMAMSPLNQSTAAAEYNSQIASYPKIELTAPQEPKKLAFKLVGTSDGQYFKVWGLSRDDNPDDAETFLFKYTRELGDNKVAVLAGQFFAISDTPGENGRYLMMYNPLDDNGRPAGRYEIAYIPQNFSIPPNYAAKSLANNNACGIASWGAFVKKFGEDAVKNAPNIEDCTNFVLNKAN